MSCQPHTFDPPPPSFLPSSPRTATHPSSQFPTTCTLTHAEQTGQTGTMHVTACLAGQKVDVEVGEDCRTLQALRETIVEALPQLCVEGFDVSVGGRALDDDEGVVSLDASVCLDVSANTRGRSILALRETGREVSEAGLLAAAETGDVSLCTLFLDAGVPIDCRDDSGNTPLHLSCVEGHVSVATLLLDRCTAIDEKNGGTGGGNTPLHLSCLAGSLSVATLLLDRGSRAIDKKNRHGETPLQVSCLDGYVSIATLLLNRGSRAIGARSITGWAPLHDACRGRHLLLARLLLDRGAAVDVGTCSGDTALHHSCHEGCLEVTTLLLDRGSRAIDQKDGRGDTPLHLACRWGHLSVAALLLDRGSRALNTKNSRGATPLHLSCSNRIVNSLPVVALLLDRGCDFDVEEYKNDPCYPVPVLELLSERGCAVQAVADDASLENPK